MGAVCMFLAQEATSLMLGSVPNTSFKGGNHFNKYKLWDSCLRAKPKSNP
jgi:hypothetical protein